MIDRVILAKARSVDRCVERVREEYVGREATFATDFTRQDAAILNLLRACEAAIDMANHVVRRRRLPLPDRAAEAFTALERAGLVAPGIAEAMRRMVGFRNVAVHVYRDLDIDRVRAVIEHRLDDLLAFKEAMIRAVSSPPDA